MIDTISGPFDHPQDSPSYAAVSYPCGACEEKGYLCGDGLFECWVLIALTSGGDAWRRTERCRREHVCPMCKGEGRVAETKDTDDAPCRCGDRCRC